MNYRLPAAVRERLSAALHGRRNRDACLTLATFIGRFWSSPRKLGLPFVLDRRALAPLEGLSLTEARIRGAIRALEQVGFLDRAVTGGRTYQATPEGLRRRPVAFTFAATYRDAFNTANKRAAAARDRRLPDRQGAAPAVARRSSPAFPQARPTNSPKYSSEANKMHLGENPSLEAALDRWRMAFWQSNGASAHDKGVIKVP